MLSVKHVQNVDFRAQNNGFDDYNYRAQHFAQHSVENHHLRETKQIIFQERVLISAERLLVGTCFLFILGVWA